MYSDSISGTGLAAVYLSKAASANLYDCTIDSSKTQGIYGKNTALTVDGCKISNSADDGIYAVSGSLKLRNSRIYDSGMRGVAVRNAQFSIVSNKIYSNGSSSVKIAGSAYGTLKSNLIGAKGISVSSSASVSRSGNKFRLSESKITLSKHKVRYTGKPIKPGIRVNFAGKTLREGKDYRIIYSDNTDCGTAKVTIKGIGKYSGSKTVNFTIK
jgi:hypothetical protein